MYYMSREPKSMIWCESLTQRTNVSRVSLLSDKEAIMREKAMMDEQSRLNGARREGGIDTLKETILDNLSELGNIPQNLINIINKEDHIDILKYWTKIAVMSKSLDEFKEKIK